MFEKMVGEALKLQLDKENALVGQLLLRNQVGPRQVREGEYYVALRSEQQEGLFDSDPFSDTVKLKLPKVVVSLYKKIDEVEG